MSQELLQQTLDAPGCERIKDFYSVGPVQRAAVESFVEALAQQEKPAQELASQTASTKPIVSQKTAETVDKDCDTCINRQRRMHQEPCFSCHGYTNWEPKP